MTVQRIDATWAAFFGLPPPVFLQPGVQVVAHHRLADYQVAWLFRHHASLCLSVPPDSVEGVRAAVRECTVEKYTGLHQAAWRGDASEVARLLALGADPNARDGHGRTPLHVAVFGSHAEAARALVRGGAQPNALDAQRYDIVTIAAVKDDVRMVQLALALGTSPRNVTSPYDGTALIAAAHLGHEGVVRELIKAGAPLDHVNNLGWTAVIEAVILGDGGTRHVSTLRALVEAGANVNITDRQGVSPLAHARGRGYAEMVSILQAAGGH